eukprot:c38765_g1_i1 orf=2-199(-)
MVIGNHKKIVKVRFTSLQFRWKCEKNMRMNDHVNIRHMLCKISSLKDKKGCVMRAFNRGPLPPTTH